MIPKFFLRLFLGRERTHADSAERDGPHFHPTERDAPPPRGATGEAGQDVAWGDETEIDATEEAPLAQARFPRTSSLSPYKHTFLY